MNLQRRSTKILIVEWVVAIGLFIYGMCTFPLALLGVDNSLIPGDLGDARFNNYILEHFHLFMNGAIQEYWNAPFLYPQQNIIAHSDNLLGTAPIYSLFRTLGSNRETSFQLWIIAMFALNYCCCFFALNSWSKHVLISSCAAFIFAFGIYNIGQMDHAQVFPRFIAPVAFLYIWRFLSTGTIRFFLFAVLATVYQFYCGIYLGFFLVYALAFLMIAHCIFNWRTLLSRISSNKRKAGPFIASMIVGAILLAPLMIPYIRVSLTLGTRTFDEVIASLPRISSYFFTHPAALSWRDLTEHSKFAYDLWWDHFLFVGALPWLTVVLALLMIWSKRFSLDDRKKMTVLLVALGSSTLFMLNFNDHTLYHIIYSLPGFSALRALGRSITVQIILFLFLFTAVLAQLQRQRRSYHVMVILLPLLVILDNKIDVTWMKFFNKWHARNLVAEVERDITATEVQGHSAIAYMPLMPIIEDESIHDRVIETNITAMLAAQQIGLPIVNGYTGSYPTGYMGFFDSMDDRSLNKWCEHSGCDTSSIARIRNVPVPVLDVDTVVLQAANGMFVCANAKRDGLTVADRPQPLLWETYLLIRTTGERIALLAHNGNFTCAELLQHQQLSATAADLGDFGLFKMVDIDDGWIALKAFNDRFLSVNDEGLIHASAGEIGEKERFRITPTGNSVQSDDHRSGKESSFNFNSPK